MDVERPASVHVDQPVTRSFEPEVTAIVADDQDFDMFLEEKEPEPLMSTEDIQAAFNATKPIWTGRVNIFFISERLTDRTD